MAFPRGASPNHDQTQAAVVTPAATPGPMARLRASFIIAVFLIVTVVAMPVQWLLLKFDLP